jgi:PAS domain S-box-containing protein
MVLVDSETSAGVMLRRLLPAALVMPMLFGWARVRGERMGMFGNESGTAVLALTFILVLCSLIWRNALEIYQIETAKARAEAAKRRADQELVSAARHTRCILDNVIDAVITIDGSGLVRSWNLAASAIFGYEPAEILGRSFKMLMPEQVRDAHDDYIAEFLRTGRSPALGRRREVVGRRKSGETFALEIAVNDFAVEGRTCFSAVARDITDRKRTEEALLTANAALERKVAERTTDLARTITALQREIAARKLMEENLRRATAAAEAASRSKSAFVADLSHEIRTPLGAVLGFAELLTGPALGTAERTVYADAVRRNCELLSALVGDVLDLSKVEAGKLDLDWCDVSLSEALSDAMQPLGRMAREKGVALSVASDADVPERLRTDPQRLRQILLNLVGNAVKLTAKGSVDVHVSRAKVGGRAKVKFVIKDTGPGIPAAYLHRLFKPFCQIPPPAPGGTPDGSPRRPRGTGLGLVLAKRLANLLGGDVTLEATAVGEGSTFAVVVDAGDLSAGVVSPGVRQQELGALRSESEADDEDHEESPPIGSTPVRLDGLRVLLTEDTEDNRTLVEQLLKSAGADVDTAGNGREAVDLAGRRTYDVVLMDLQMPIMDGYEATATLRRSGTRTPIIALTAHALREERQRCLASGFTKHLSKPVSRGILLETLAQYLPARHELS